MLARIIAFIPPPVQLAPARCYEIPSGVIFSLFGGRVPRCPLPKPDPASKTSVEDGREQKRNPQLQENCLRAPHA
jgi:hypothetical protein